MPPSSLLDTSCTDSGHQYMALTSWKMSQVQPSLVMLAEKLGIAISEVDIQWNKALRNN